MLKSNNNILIKAIVLLAGYCLGVGSLGNAEYSPTSQQRRLLFDHEAQFSERRDLGFGELNTGKMGDYIDLNTGELSFRHTDISIPGNFDLPVEVTRIIDSDRDRPTFTKSEVLKGSSGTANWGLDLPYILLPSIDSSGTVGCYSESTAVDEKDAMFVVPRLSVPAQRWVLLNTSSTSNTAVFGSNEPDYTNNEMWKINQTKKNGKCAWTAIDTKGVTYEFGQTFVLATKNGKSKHAVLITKVTDVNGNTVTYAYDSTHKRLKLITGSDGRKIKLVYRSNGELECIITDNGKRVWIYEFKKVTKSSSEKYLSKVYLMGNSKHYWQYDALAGVYKYNVTRTDGGTNHARRCVFGRNARVRNLDGLVANYVTRKIVNFSQAKSGSSGREGTSHRAACLSPTDGGDFADGVSSYGNFSTYFTSAVTNKTLTDVDGSTAIWRYSYGEGDEFNSNQSYLSVHKNRNSPVYVDVTKPKMRTVTDPLGNKYEFAFGRSLNNSGLLLSVEIFEKGSKVSARKVEYEHVFSVKALGHAWNRGKSGDKTNEHWSRTSKRVWTEGGETYNVSSNFDSKGAKIKSTKASTVQTGSIVEEIEVLHISSKWILGLQSKVTVNGKEISGATYDTKGQITLETKYGEQFQRYKWNDSGHLIAVRNGADHITEFLNHKRGTPQKIILPNDAVYNLSVDRNGWVTRITNPLGYTENYTHNKLGWLTKIDRPTGYADTTITFVAPKGKKGVVKTEQTGSTSRKKIEIFTFNGYGQTILHETSNTGKTVSIFVQTKYNKLGRKSFESWPSLSKTTFNGILTKYDVLGREIELQESVSPYAKVKFKYLSGNEIQRIDENGNSTLLGLSGYGSPFDGKETLIAYPNLLRTYLSYDKWQNLTQIKHSGNGTSLLRNFKYNSRHQLCLAYFPEVGTEAFTYNSGGQVASSEKGVSKHYTCEQPETVSISALTKTCVTKKYIAWSYGGQYRITKVTCNYENSNRNKPSTPGGAIPEELCGVTPYEWCNYSLGSMSSPQGSTTEPIALGLLSEQSEPVSVSSSNKVLYSYNQLGKVIKVDFPSSDYDDDIYNIYDSIGKLVSTTRGKLSRHYVYGARNELLSETFYDDKKSFKSSYTFNESGGLTSYTNPDYVRLHFGLNDFDQIISVRIGGKTYIDNVKYHPNGIVKSATFRTKVSTNEETLQYTASLNDRMLIESRKLTRNKDTLFSFSHTYFKNRHIKSIEDLVSSYKGFGKRSFLYDSMNQITSAGDAKRTESYTFDIFSNFLTKSFTFDSVKYSDTLSYDNATNRLTSISNTEVESTGGSEDESTKSISNLSLGYDDNGNVTNYNNEIDIHYNNLNQIVKTHKENDFTQVFTFDGINNRAKVYETNQQLTSTTYSLLSKNGLFVYESNLTGNDPVRRATAKFNFEDIAVLQIEKCNYWIFTVPSNNTVFQLTDKNKVQRARTVSPFGSSWNKENSKIIESEIIEDNTTCTKPKPIIIPPWPGIPIPPGYCWMLCGIQQDSGVATKSKKPDLFKNVVRDYGTGFYFLRSKRFYDAEILRYLSVKGDIRRSVDDGQRYLLNLYSISQNNTIRSGSLLDYVDTGQSPTKDRIPYLGFDDTLSSHLPKSLVAE